MTVEMAKAYDPAEAQEKWLDYWEKKGFFHSSPDSTRVPFTIVIPPPNVTGALHLGHALNNTLQDILIRFQRMRGRNALWVPGTDHAGIATQAMVEKRIKETEGKSRHQLGRDEMVQRIWSWKDQFEARILGQLKQLGASCDWARTRFTLDPTCARAVRETFFKMFKDGLIFRGKRLVNWDAHLQTSVADDETYVENIKGGFWTFKYPLTNRPGEFIRFSTTRPETMLGDVAVCVHPSDERYQSLIGQFVEIPLVGRSIPIIGDALLADPTLGTGCVKVTPAHDPNDYACGQRNKLPMINILNPDGTINENGGKYAGMDRYKAREAIIAEMTDLGLFEGREDRDIPLKFSDRSKSPIEPFLSDQWFVKMDQLAQSAIEAVQDKRVQFYPERYSRTYLDWLSEKRDWCVSRQLWWGHRIPIWYCSAPEEMIRKALADRKDICYRPSDEPDRWLICSLEDIPEDLIGKDYPLTQDPDVLDTWFSSALWPHSTLGWPEATPELKYYYPTNVLVTSRDIITLWVARMVMTGLYNVGEVPFSHVYIHPKILDGFGETMSKSKGNGIDPLDIIARYGTDALRFVMAYIATETQDSRMPVANVCPHCDTLVAVKQEHMYMRTRKVPCPECKKAFRPGGPWPADDPDLPTARQASERFDIGRNFANKLWNASRFLLMNLEGYVPGEASYAELPLEDRWILSRLTETAAETTLHLEGFRFGEAIRLLYDFTWSEFCDWYVEMAKGRLRQPEQRAQVQRVLIAVLDGILRLVHPFMPFVTESIWQALEAVAPVRGVPTPQAAAKSVCIAPWPSYSEGWVDQAIKVRIKRMQDLVGLIRETRNRYLSRDPRTPLDIAVRTSESNAQDLWSLSSFISLLGSTGKMDFGPNVSKPTQSATQVHPDFELYVSLAGLIDVPSEVARLKKQLMEKEKAILSAKSKLANTSFVERAKPEVVQGVKDQIGDLEKQIQIIHQTLHDLDGK